MRGRLSIFLDAQRIRADNMEKLYKIYVCHHWSLLHVSATKCISQYMLLHCGSPLRLPLAASTVAVPIRLPLKNCMLPRCGSPLRLPLCGSPLSLPLRVLQCGSPLSLPLGKLHAAALRLTSLWGCRWLFPLWLTTEVAPFVFPQKSCR